MHEIKTTYISDVNETGTHETETHKTETETHETDLDPKRPRPET